MDWKLQLYWRMPRTLQEILLSTYASRLQKLYYGPAFATFLERYRREQNTWSWSDARTWQDRRLRAVLRLAAEKVPYYRQSYVGVDWRSVRSVRDLSRLPLLEKQSIRKNERVFLADGVDHRNLCGDRTSGTTGTALRIFWPRRMEARYWALVEVAVRQVAGVSQEIPRAMVGGRPVVRGDTTDAPYWRFNRRWRQLYLSSYHISRKTVAGYVEALRSYESEWITGYGSAIAALAGFALDAGLEPVPMRAAIVSGDTLFAGMRADIERFFSCKCHDQYGQAERVCMAMECGHGRMHVVPQLGIIEILRPDGSPCSDGETGEIVATGLLNEAMPLIRYRLGDTAAWDPSSDCPCGNPFPSLLRLEGRVDDFLVTCDGRRIGRLSTAMKSSPTIHSAQLVQDRPGHAYLLLRPGADYQRSHARAVKEDILARIGRFELEEVEVPEIPKIPGGKTALVIRLSDRPQLHTVYQALLGKPLG